MEDLGDALSVIKRYWAFTEEPPASGWGNGTTGSRPPASTIVLRADVALSLRFWLRYLSLPERVDCTDVLSMTEVLSRHAGEFGEWEGAATKELMALAHAVRMVARPPQRDRVRIGDCPRCHKAVRVSLTQRVPLPTTDPEKYPLWTDAPTASLADTLIRHPCGETATLEQWYIRLVGSNRRMVADEVVKELHSRLGVRISPGTLRVWSRRGMIPSRGYSAKGAALYDLREVIVAYITRDSALAG